MTKDELPAANERLGAEVAALCELLTVIASARPPLPAGSDGEGRYRFTGSVRLTLVSAAAAEALRHAGERDFASIARAHAAGLRGDFSGPLGYEPAPVTDGSEQAAEVTT